MLLRGTRNELCHTPRAWGAGPLPSAATRGRVWLTRAARASGTGARIQTLLVASSAVALGWVSKSHDQGHLRGEGPSRKAPVTEPRSGCACVLARAVSSRQALPRCGAGGGLPPRLLQMQPQPLHKERCPAALSSGLPSQYLLGCPSLRQTTWLGAPTEPGHAGLQTFRGVWQGPAALSGPGTDFPRALLEAVRVCVCSCYPGCRG